MMNLGNYFLYAAPISEMLHFGLLKYQTEAHWETPRVYRRALQNWDADAPERRAAAIDAGGWKTD
jgi:hypothetical protein